MKFAKHIILLSACFFTYAICPGQNESLHFEHIGFDEGPSKENVLSMLQDSKGYMWFGTLGGLNKYDGYSFTKYQFDPFDSNSISQGVVYTIFEDKFGSIWVGTTDGLSKFDRATEKFTSFTPYPNTKFSDPNITAINEDSDGMMWVGSFGGLYRFDRQRGVFLPDEFDLIGANCIYKDRTGTLWIGNQTGLHKLNLTPKKNNKLSEVNFTHYQNEPGNPNSLSSNIIKSIFEDRHGIIWMATDNGLNSFDRKTGIFKRYQHDVRNSHSISTNNLATWLGKSIQEDPEGNLWIGTDNGLNKLNAERSAFTSYLHNPDDAYSLSTNTVISLHVDNGGILYASSWGGKLNIANLNVKAFALRRRDPNNVNSLSSNAVTSMIEDSSGIFWIGTYGGGLNRWNKNTNQFTHFRHKPSNSKSLKSDTIQAVLDDRHGHLWVCNGDVLSKLNRQTGEFSHYYSNVKNYRDLHDRFIYSITQDSDGFLWLGTGNGIKRFDEKTGEFQHYYHDPADTTTISDATTRAMFTDSKGNIWVGYGSKGMDKFNSRSVRFIHYKYNSNDSTSISSNAVNCFFENSKGNVWLGTLAGGLCHFDYKTGKFSTVTDKHGLPSNTIHSILSDNNNHLWLGTDNGLSRFDPVAKTFTNYDYKDGLQSNIFAAGNGGDDMSWGACCKGRDGTLYFGGNNGFNFFKPLHLKANSNIAPVVITQFKLFDSLVKGANESKEIVLDHDENYFSFEFSSLSFYNPAKNQYAYKLEGVDKDWVYSGSRHYVGYTNIDPGKYTFRVKGTNNDGVWNEEGTSMIVIINPPWYRTWWAYILFTLSFVGLVYAFIRYRINKIRMQHEIVVQKHKATELEMQALRAQMNPHFIFNSLNSINRFILQNNKEQASEYLTKFSKLVRLILQNSNATLITLESELEALQLYLELESLRFNHRFSFKISVDDEIEAEIIKVPPLIIQPYAENAIWHGLMHKTGIGNLEIEIKEEKNFLQIKISDDGIGRKKAGELKSKSAETHKSMGLKITEDRIAMMSKEENKGVVVINDLVHADGTAAGTEVMIKILSAYD
jgi:ligand-binding sensor domain-containing protein